jgi:hypothetical protein
MSIGAFLENFAIYTPKNQIFLYTPSTLKKKIGPPTGMGPRSLHSRLMKNTLLQSSFARSQLHFRICSQRELSHACVNTQRELTHAACPFKGQTTAHFEILAR